MSLKLTIIDSNNRSIIINGNLSVSGTSTEKSRLIKDIRKIKKEYRLKDNPIDSLSHDFFKELIKREWQLKSLECLHDPAADLFSDAAWLAGAGKSAEDNILPDEHPSSRIFM